jgi:hypothetical protein
MTHGGWLGLLGLIIAAPDAVAQTLHYEGGVSVSSGDYIFTERTTSWTVYSGLAFSAGPLTLRGTVPVYIQNTTLLTGSSAGPVPTGGSHSGAVGDSSAARKGRGDGMGRGTSSAAVTAPSFAVATRAEDGSVEVPASAVTGFAAAVGDPTVHLSLQVWDGTRSSVTLGAGAKIPATDTTAFGTGEWDVGAALSLSHRLGFSTLLGVDVSYWHLGDLPDLDLRDPIAVSASVAYLRRTGWGASGWVSGSRSPIEGFEDTYSLGVGVTRVGSRGALGLTVSVGLSETAADFSMGVNWRVRLLRA